MEWYCVLGLSASLLAGRTTNVPKGCPLVRGTCPPSNTRTLRPLMAFSSGKTSPLLAAVQSQRWVQCRSLSLTLKRYSYKNTILIPWKPGNQTIENGQTQIKTRSDLKPPSQQPRYPHLSKPSRWEYSQKIIFLQPYFLNQSSISVKTNNSNRASYNQTNLSELYQNFHHLIKPICLNFTKASYKIKQITNLITWKVLLNKTNIIIVKPNC